MKLRALSLLAAVLLCSCAGKAGSAHDPQTPGPAPTLLVASRGITMPLRNAVRYLNFAPFIPSAQIAGVAVIPPLSDDEKKRAPGIAIEYDDGGDALLLSQWPREGLRIAVGGFDATSRPCAPVAYKPDGLLWTTRNGRVMTLQADGTVAASRVAREAGRLLRAGACERRTTTRIPLRFRPSPPSRAASLPRRSAF